MHVGRMKWRQAIKNPFVKYLALILAATIGFDFYYKTLEVAEKTLTGAVFSNILIFAGTLYTIALIIHFALIVIKKQFFPALCLNCKMYRDDIYELHKKVDELKKPKRKKK